MRPLAPEDVLVRAPGSQIDWQSDGRLVVHHARGASLLDGISRAEAEQILAAVDGNRSAFEVCELVAPGIPPARSRRLLRLWLGELLLRRSDNDQGTVASVVDRDFPAAGPEAGHLATIGILGGGSAGHLAALALRRALPNTAVTLIESPRHPVIGVGEATTPLMPQFLQADLGLDFDDFWQRVRPTPKLGIQFVWGPEAGDSFPYPFGAVEPPTAQSVDGHLHHLSPHALRMGGHRLPSPSGQADLGAEVAYHLDNRRFVAWLTRQSAARGVELLQAEIVEVEVGGQRVEALRTDDGRRLCFDLYLDCSGFASRLLGRALATPWHSFRGSLFNDRALVGATPRSTPPAPYTEARALSGGWCWNTPERESDHRGYVYSSDFLDRDQAETEFRSLYPNLGALRELEFRSGRHARFRRGNVVALGNAYGFVEPLESTALHLLIRQIGWLAEGLAAEDPGHAWPVIETRCAQAWDYLAWFLALHFRFNRAMESDYWRTCRELCDIERHRELVTSFERRGPLTADPLFAAGGFAAPDPLWGPEGIDVLLLGQRVPHRASTAPDPEVARQWRRRVEGWRNQVERGLDPQGWLDELDRSATARRRFVAAFEQRGPAFPVLRELAERPPTARSVGA